MCNILTVFVSACFLILRKRFGPFRYFQITNVVFEKKTTLLRYNVVMMVKDKIDCSLYGHANFTVRWTFGQMVEKPHIETGTLIAHGYLITPNTIWWQFRSSCKRWALLDWGCKSGPVKRRVLDNESRITNLFAFIDTKCPKTCSPGRSRLYRLGVSQAQKAKESGDERPRLSAS